MTLTRSTVRRQGLLGAVGLGVVAAATIAVPAANADPAPCTAAGLANTVSSVTGSAGQYLDAHPDVNDALTRSGSLSPGDAKASMMAYFVTHPTELADLRGIVQPLTNLREQCNSTISRGQITALLDEFAP
jgi:heme-binding protein